jgi:hypothetical protein
MCLQGPASWRLAKALLRDAQSRGAVIEGSRTAHALLWQHLCFDFHFPPGSGTTATQLGVDIRRSPRYLYFNIAVVLLPAGDWLLDVCKADPRKALELNRVRRP